MKAWSFEKLLSWLRIHREEGFIDALVIANQLDKAVELPLELRQYQEEKNSADGAECFDVR